MKPGFDLDGVVIDMEPHLTAALRIKFGWDCINHEEPRRFSYKIDGVSRNEISQTINNAVLACTPLAQPIPGSIETLTNIWELTGEPLIFVTARHSKTFNVTMQWLSSHLAEGVQYILSMCHNTSKISMIKQTGINIFVDDRFKIAQEVAPHVLVSCLFDQPWNTGRELAPANACRIHTLDTVLTAISMAKAS